MVDHAHHAHDLVSSLSKSTGVDHGSVEKILNSLGFEAVLREASTLTGGSTSTLKAENLKLAVRIGRNGLVV